MNVYSLIFWSTTLISQSYLSEPSCFHSASLSNVHFLFCIRLCAGKASASTTQTSNPRRACRRPRRNILSARAWISLWHASASTSVHTQFYFFSLNVPDLLTTLMLLCCCLSVAPGSFTALTRGPVPGVCRLRERLPQLLCSRRGVPQTACI